MICNTQKDFLFLQGLHFTTLTNGSTQQDLEYEH